MTPFFVFPPHPRSSCRIRREVLPRYESTGRWVAQRKFGGAHCVIYACKDGRRCLSELWDRRGKHFTHYRFDAPMQACVAGLRLKPRTPYVLAGELLHFKATYNGRQVIRNTIVLFDVLHAGKPLVPWTQRQRLDLLTNICQPVELEPGGRGYLLAQHEGRQLWMAEEFRRDWRYHFDEFFAPEEPDPYPEIEGLILRLLDSHLQIGTRAYDVDSMLRVRKARDKVYTF